MSTLSLAQLKQLASHGAPARLAELRAEIAAIINAFPGIGAATSRKPRRRDRKRSTLSPAGRARISAAQRARWAAVKQAKGAGGGKRKGMSRAARKALGARMTKHWAERRTTKAAKK